jgi:hypothetical protein
MVKPKDAIYFALTQSAGMTMREYLLAALLLCPNLLSAQTLRGTLTDSITGAALAGYTVKLVNLGKNEERATTADSAGQFAFQDLGNGRYEVQVDAFNRSFRRGPFTVFRGEVLNLQIQLAPSAVEVAPVTATASSRSRKLELNGFYDRMINSRPQYMVRGEIEKKNARTIPDLISHMKGLRIERTSRGADVLMRSGVAMGALRSGNTCRPAVFIDGAQVRAGGNAAPLVYLDAMQSPENIEAIEVYAGIAQIPAQYSGASSGCGVILIWTR